MGLCTEKNLNRQPSNFNFNQIIVYLKLHVQTQTRFMLQILHKEQIRFVILMQYYLDIENQILLLNQCLTVNICKIIALELGVWTQMTFSIGKQVGSSISLYFSPRFFLLQIVTNMCFLIFFLLFIFQVCLYNGQRRFSTH